MPRTSLIAVALCLALAPVVQAQQAAPAKKLYCWDEAGRRVCGDALPASAVGNARVEINARSGMPTARIDRALTPEERLAAEARAREEQKANEAAEAEKRRWMAMVETFQSEADLRRAFDNRVQLSQGSIDTARMGIDGLRDSLVGLLRRAGQLELEGKPVPKTLATEVQTQHVQLRRQQALLARLQHDAAEIRTQLDEAVTRYREVKAPAAPLGTLVPTG